MDYSYDEEQQLLQRTAREFLERECPASFVREMEADERGYSPELWRRIVRLGWTGLGIPQQYGGTGGNLLHLMALYEEFGRALFPSPHFPSVVQAGQLVLAAGTEEQKTKLLPRIADGERILTLALIEPSFTYDPRPQATTAMTDGDHFVVNGTKLFVPDAHVADSIICVARTDDDGVALLTVGPTAPGVHVNPMPSIAEDRQFEVTFEQVRVPRGDVLGKPGQGWEPLQRVLEIAVVLQCASMVGALQRVLEMTVDYAKTRVQFGRPIGSFQAVSHKCSEMVLMTDGSRFLTYKAGWLIKEGLPAAREVAMAKNWVSQSMEMCCFEAHQIHGGVGATIDYDLQLYTRRGKVFEMNLGDQEYYLHEVSKYLEEAPAQLR